MAEMIYPLVTALHCQRWRGVIFFFVQKVVYRYSLTAGSDAETIVIPKISSVSFGLDGSVRENLKVAK